MIEIPLDMSIWFGIAFVFLGVGIGITFEEWVNK